MDLQNDQSAEEEVSDYLWRAISALQAMTDRLLTQHGRTARVQDDDVYSLTSRAAI